jgi:hypothetical protein
MKTGGIAQAAEEDQAVDASGAEEGGVDLFEM